MESENEISVGEEKRVPLTEEMKIFLRNCPLVLMPTLGEIIKKIPKSSLYGTKDYKSKATSRSENITAHDKGRSTEVSSDALSNNLQAAGSPAKLPETPIRSSEENGNEAGPSSSLVSDAKNLDKSPGTPMEAKDVREDDSMGESELFAALNLVRRTTAPRAQEVKETVLPFQLRNKLRARSGQVVSYFMSSHLPISSTLGRKIIRSGLGRCLKPAGQVARYERYCTTQMQRNQLAGVTHWPVVSTSSAVLKPGQYCHKYSFGTRQRVSRNVELILGLSAKSFPLLNKCRDVSIPLHKMSDGDVAQAMYNLQNPRQARDYRKAKPGSTRAARRWIASEPTAGPSRDVEKIAQPVVLLDDIIPFPVRYFS